MYHCRLLVVDKTCGPDLARRTVLGEGGLHGKEEEGGQKLSRQHEGEGAEQYQYVVEGLVLLSTNL